MVIEGEEVGRFVSTIELNTVGGIVAVTLTRVLDEVTYKVFNNAVNFPCDTALLTVSMSISYV